MSNRRDARQRRQRERDAQRRPLRSLDEDGESASRRRRRLSREALDATAEAREQWAQEREPRDA